MKLLQVAKLEWRILAVCDHRDRCQVHDFLERAEKRLKIKMKALLEQTVANNGPDLHNENMARYLYDEIYEFKRGPKTGAKIRVIFFRDNAQKRVICTEAYVKTNDSPAPYVTRAVELHKQYKQALDGNEIRIIRKREYDNGKTNR